MANRISKRVREEAAVLCAIAASTNWELMPLTDDASLDHSSEWFQSGAPDHNTLAGQLANAAVCVARGYVDDIIDEAWAEAESLLRCGWSPGEEP